MGKLNAERFAKLSEGYEKERADLKQALRKLEKRPLQVIWLHYFGGYKFKEISQTLGITAKSASNICKSAAKKLNELLS